MHELGTKTTLVFLPADGEASFLLLWSLVSLRSGGTVQPENTCILKVAGQVWESQKRIIIKTNHSYDQHSWDMGQNALDQSDCRVFMSTVSLEENDAKARFSVCWYRLMEIKSWFTILRGFGQKWVWPLWWSKDSNIGCISRRN